MYAWTDYLLLLQIVWYSGTWWEEWLVSLLSSWIRKAVSKWYLLAACMNMYLYNYRSTAQASLVPRLFITHRKRTCIQFCMCCWMPPNHHSLGSWVFFKHGRVVGTVLQSDWPHVFHQALFPHAYKESWNKAAHQLAGLEKPSSSWLLCHYTGHTLGWIIFVGC